MLPQPTKAIARLEKPIKIIKIEKDYTQYGFPTTETEWNTKAAVQPADPIKLQLQDFNYSLEYLQLHSRDLSQDFKINDILEYRGKRYLIIRKKDFSDYGFRDFVAEEIK